MNLSKGQVEEFQDSSYNLTYELHDVWYVQEKEPVQGV